MFHATIVIGFFWTSRSERTPQNPFIQSERKRLRFDVALTLRSAEMQALRDYVTAADGYRYANQVSRFEMESWRLDLHSKVSKDKDIGALFSTPELHHWSTAEAASTLRLDVTHSNLIQRWHDLVFDSNMSVRALRLGKDIWGSWDHVWTIIVIHSIYTYVYFIWRHLNRCWSFQTTGIHITQYHWHKRHHSRLKHWWIMLNWSNLSSNYDKNASSLCSYSFFVFSAVKVGRVKEKFGTWEWRV